MLRIAVLILLLANAGYYAWARGLLSVVDLMPASQSEPQRMEQQIEPDKLRLLPPMPPALSRVSSPSSAIAPACLQAGVFEAAQAAALRAALTSWPEGSWTLEPATIASRWMIYIGRFASDDATVRKRAELRALNIPFDRPGPALEPGLSLGRFASEDAAQRGLSQLTAQGVRTARVVQERAEAPGFTLRLPAVDDALRQRLDALQPALAGKALRACG